MMQFFKDFFDLFVSFWTKTTKYMFFIKFVMNSECFITEKKYQFLRIGYTLLLIARTHAIKFAQIKDLY